MKTIFQILFILFLAAVSSVNISAQDKKSCQVTKDLGGKFKFVRSSTSVVNGENVFFLTIKLSPEKFTNDYLLKTAQRIRETYCNETFIYAEIWDSSDKRVFDDLTPAPAYSPWTKAVYKLDRKKGSGLLQLIAGEKVTGEIKINQ